MRLRTASAVIGLVVILGGCGSSATSESSTTSPQRDVTVVRLNQAAIGSCSYIRDFLKDVNSFSGYGKLAALASHANDHPLQKDGMELAAALNPRNQSAVDAVMLKLQQTCLELGVIKAPTVVATEPIN